MPRSVQPAPVRWLIRGLLAAYFRRIDRFHLERAPAAGPVLFVANHPGSLTDAFVIGTSLDRPVHFVASVVLFKSRPLAWLLSRCGVIPINRRQDDPTKMATVVQTFDACFAVLEAGGAVGIFPEGVTYDDAQLKEVKTGAARLALALEARHRGALGLAIVPVGLTYSGKERFRSRVLVHVGEALRAADFLEGDDDDPRPAVRTLTTEIEQRIRALILDVPALNHERIVTAVRRLYLDKLRAANLVVTEPLPADAETLVLLQAIARALRHFDTHEPARLAAFVAELDRYERWLDRLDVSDRSIASYVSGRPASSRAATAVVMVVAAPVALFGWLHHLVPSRLVAWAVERFTPADRRKSQTPLTVMFSGLIALAICYPIYVGAIYAWLGAWPAVAYAVALPLSGLAGHYYLRALRRYGGRLRTAGIFLQRPITRRLLLAMRARLIERLEAFRADYARTLVPELNEVGDRPG